MTKKRPVINVNTLQIYPSLSACAKSEGLAPSCILRRIARTYRLNYHPFEKTNNKKFAYLDEWLPTTDEQKRKDCMWHNVDFLSMVY